MCGIAGIVSWGNAREETLRTTASAMAEALSHRGPDAHGVWVGRDGRAALAHTRLSILDLSKRGSQPMHSPDGRYVLVYNGEIYNHHELRGDLAASGHSFRGDSDTETLLAGIGQWGLEDTLARAIGMFALALWDRTSGRLTLARDRIGIKPLYYGWTGGHCAFASELKAIRVHPQFGNPVSTEALSAFFRRGYIPAPLSIYQDIFKLLPGHMISFSEMEQRPEPMMWWDARATWNQGETAPFQGTRRDALERLESLLEDSVRVRMLSDVPLGAFLSGGIDSSLVVSLMQKNSASPVKTFTIGFEDARYNEAGHARRVARELGTDHTEFILTPDDMLQCVETLPEIWDEPFADSSQIPTYLLSRLTRDKVTVALSGDGGDELFFGYQRYFWGVHWPKLAAWPLALRKLAGGAARSLPRALWSLSGPRGGKIHDRLDLLEAPQFRDFYHRLTTLSQRSHAMVRQDHDTLERLDGEKSLLRSMALWDIRHYLPDDILTKVDRASMACGLEVRVPLLDHRVMAFAASLPDQMKVEGGNGKLVLRELLHRHVPRDLVERPKAGFTVPTEQWMAGPLRQWCDDLLSRESLQASGLLDADAASRVWTDYRNGQAEHHSLVWALVSFQSWWRRWQ